MNLSGWQLMIITRIEGIEPTHTVLKTVVLPLNYIPMSASRGIGPMQLVHNAVYFNHLLQDFTLYPTFLFNFLGFVGVGCAEGQSRHGNTVT